MRAKARYNFWYTKGMKTAISLPEDLFHRAEAAARKLRMSRSQLYATAIREFIERRQAAKITQHLNEVYSTEPARIDPAVASGQSKSIEKESW
jgi:metal-responsive CopG/Arc/MetJ family transcriptional regulator